MTVPALELTQFTVTESAPGYWRAAFDHPPTNLMNAFTAAELRAIVEAAEEVGDLRALVFDSASAESETCSPRVRRGQGPRLAIGYCLGWARADRASDTAASLLSARPCARRRAMAASPRWCAGTR